VERAPGAGCQHPRAHPGKAAVRATLRNNRKDPLARLYEATSNRQLVIASASHSSIYKTHISSPETMQSPPQTLDITFPVDPPKMRTGFTISAERLEEGIAAYAEDQKEILRFWFFLAKDNEWSLKDLSVRCGVSSTAMSRVLNGKYQAEVTSFIDTLIKAKASYSESAPNPDFIATSLAKRMFSAFDKTRALGNVTIMWGAKGIGKTTIEEEYARLNNHGKTAYVRCPGHGVTVFQFAKLVARSLRVSTSTKTVTFLDLRDKIILALSRGGRLLIVDELHEIFLTCPHLSIIKICEFIREIVDVSKCGAVLSGTEVLEASFFKGQYAAILSQLVDRGTVQSALPDKPTQKDILLFINNFGLQYPDEVNHPEAFSIVNDVIKLNSLRKLTHRLRDGASYAAKLNQRYTWAHFVAAFDAIRKLSK
jgi:DNA transposition AAA+ family ATPase